MTKVIGFRLDGQHPVEGQALAVLESYRQAGHGTRQIMANALLALDGQPLPQPEGTIDTSELARLVEEFAGLLAELQQMDWSQAGATRRVDEIQERANGISDGLMGSIARSVRVHKTE